MRLRFPRRIILLAAAVSLVAVPVGPATAGPAPEAPEAPELYGGLAAAAGLAASGKTTSDGDLAAELGPPVAATGEAGAAPVAGGARTMAAIPVIDRANKQAVTAAYRDYYLAARSVPMGWTGSAAANVCDAGNISQDAQTGTFDAVNYFRRMAGLEPVTENTAASRVARKTALIMQANAALSHTPPTTWKCYNTNGALVAAKSNIAWGSGGDGILAGAKAIAAYMSDIDVVELGHRRWILSAGQKTMGAGSTSNANALVWGNGNAAGWDAAVDPTFTNIYSTTWSTPQLVAWPGAGYFPHQLTKSEFPNAQPTAPPTMDWSVATGSASISFGAAAVSVTKNGQAVAVSLTPQSTLSSGYGDRGAFAFRFPAGVVTQPAAGQVDTYAVSISNITGYGTLQYEVKIFNAMEATIDSVTISGAPEVGQPLTAQVAGLSPADATVNYQWLRDGSVAIGTNSSTYTPVAADATHTISVRATPFKSGYTSVPRTSAATAAVPAPPAPPDPPTPPVPPDPPVTQAMTVAKPVVSGTVRVGSALTVAEVATSPAGGEVSYQWVVGGAAVKSGSDAAARSYTPAAADAGKALYVKVTATRAGYETATNQSDTRTVEAAVDNCGVAQAVISPRLWVTGGLPTTSASEVQRSQVLRICNNGDLHLYTLNTATMQLEYTAKIGSGWTGWKISAPGDWDRDGYNDIIGIDPGGRMYLYPRTKDNTWAPRKQIGWGWQIYTRVMPVGDLTKDGNPDMLAIDARGELFMYQGDGKGGWKNGGRRTRVGGGWIGFELLAAGDLNGDKISDIMSIAPAGTLYWYRSIGSGQFYRPVWIGGGWVGFRAISGASMDGDAIADLVSVDGAGVVRFYKGAGQGGFGRRSEVAYGWK
ncbi:MAG: FG-GAP-like repeat-containing protein [Bifidobacteriaceae bacterium]|jgi:uncharacterized protein YkwD|nr:FG-GAP-like repeat-containing protein [Bifidobacteriaceae bacterium]